MVGINSGLIRQHHSKFIVLERIIDILVIGVTLWAVLDMLHMPWNAVYTWWLLISLFSFQVFAEFTDVYKQIRGGGLSGTSKHIFIAWSYVVCILLIINQFYSIVTDLNQQVFIYWCIVVPIELVSWHIITYWIFSLIRKMGRNSRRVAIIGDTLLGHELEGIFRKEDWMGLRFVGFFDDRAKARNGQAEQIISGNIKEVIRQAKVGEVDIIYITLALKAENRIKDILVQLSDTTASVYYVPDLFVFDLLRSSLRYIQGIPVVSVHDTPYSGVDGVFKRIFDVLVSLLILMIIAIPMLIIALSVKLTSSGDILFKQRRYGLRGEKIVVWKFRSMTVSEDEGNVEQATKNDPRVTKLGAFLRRTSLDELPQFFNVVQGRMSIVGPRPHAVAHNELYRIKIQGYMLRHKVKPGITGLAQIRGFRGETDTIDKMEGRIKCDLEYISRWTLWLDVKIVFLTIFKGFIGKGAY